MTVLAFKIFLTSMVSIWVLGQLEGIAGNRLATLSSTMVIVLTVIGAFSGFAWVMLFIWLPW